MSLAISWTDNAKQTFADTILQIESKWGEKSAEKFVREANRIIQSIASQPYLFKASYSENLRQALITKQTSMFYEVYSSHIVILYFWDNRQEPIL